MVAESSIGVNLDSGPIDPADVAVNQLPFSDEQETWFNRICSGIDQARLRDLLVEMVDIASPTGEEAELAAHLVERSRPSGLETRYQPIDGRQANAILRWPGAAHGPVLLLYAPIDTHTTGDEKDDLPWAARELRADMKPRAVIDRDYVYGLGANNPKGHAACVIAAAEAIAKAQAPFAGSLVAGLGAGGMPSHGRPGSRNTRSSLGHGVGCSYMLEKGVFPDFAVIAKTGWAVSWEEVGLAWFRIRVAGSFNYTGIRHFVRYDNPIVTAAQLIPELERWFAEYAAKNASGLVTPQASIGALEAGWTYMPTYIPEACDLYLDVRISPRTSIGEVQNQFAEAMDRFQSRIDGLRLSWEMMLSIPGTRTDPRNWIVQSAMRAWEHVEGAPHVPRGNQSGATDADVLRGHGVPTARIGLARVGEDAPMPDDFSRGMNVVDVREMERLTKLLVRMAVDTCMRSRKEVELEGSDVAVASE